MNEFTKPSRDWLKRLADAEDECRSVSAGGMAADLGMPSVRLERGESVKWHDGEQWRVGHVLSIPFQSVFEIRGESCHLIGTVDGVYAVSSESSALQPYPSRCERCGGDGFDLNEDGDAMSWAPGSCPACQGSGRSKP